MKPDRNKYLLASDFFEATREIKDMLRGEIEDLRNLVMSIEKRFKESLQHHVVSSEGLRTAVSAVRRRRMEVDGLRLRQIRKTMGMTQKELAARFEKNQVLICLMERGKRSAHKILEELEGISQEESA